MYSSSTMSFSHYAGSRLLSVCTGRKNRERSDSVFSPQIHSSLQSLGNSRGTTRSVSKSHHPSFSFYKAPEGHSMVLEYPSQGHDVFVLRDRRSSHHHRPSREPQRTDQGQNQDHEGDEV